MLIKLLHHEFLLYYVVIMYIWVDCGPMTVQGKRYEGMSLYGNYV